MLTLLTLRRRASRRAGRQAALSDGQRFLVFLILIASFARHCWIPRKSPSQLKVNAARYYGVPHRAAKYR